NKQTFNQYMSTKSGSGKSPRRHGPHNLDTPSQQRRMDVGQEDMGVLLLWEGETSPEDSKNRGAFLPRQRVVIDTWQRRQWYAEENSLSPDDARCSRSGHSAVIPQHQALVRRTSSKILDSLELNINRYYKSNPGPDKHVFTGFEYVGVDHENIENLEAFSNIKLLDIFDTKNASVLNDANFIDAPPTTGSMSDVAFIFSLRYVATSAHSSFLPVG
ncbi:hypothetical protein CYMTET_49487, partial [Cymbomonas tetramitiformis]